MARKHLLAPATLKGRLPIRADGQPILMLESRRRLSIVMAQNALEQIPRHMPS